MFKNNIILEDTTLRDGEQTPGLAFNESVKIDIFNSLVNIGVKWIEAGIPAMGGKESKVLKEMLERKNEVNIIAWNRGVIEDINKSLSLGFKHIHIGLPTSDIHLDSSIKKDRLWLVNKASDLIKYVKDKDCYVSISAEDVGRTNINFLNEYATVVKEAGADRLRLSDTIGILTSEEYYSIVNNISNNVSIDLQCHCHNDFGLAVANTIAGLKGGARFFHTCINGIGERAGMPDFAQIVLLLKILYKKDLGIKTELITDLCNKVAKYINTKLYSWQPIVGENVFSHESGIHVNGMLRNSNSFEPFTPDIVGGERKVIIGKHSGRSSIKYVIENIFNMEVKEDLLKLCLEKVRELSISNGRSVSYDELKDIYIELSKEGVV